MRKSRRPTHQRRGIPTIDRKRKYRQPQVPANAAATTRPTIISGYRGDPERDAGVCGVVHDGASMHRVTAAHTILPSHCGASASASGASRCITHAIPVTAVSMHRHHNISVFMHQVSGMPCKTTCCTSNRSRPTSSLRLPRLALLM